MEDFGKMQQHILITHTAVLITVYYLITDTYFFQLKTLLDLKQKQANAWEARFARQQAEQTTKQGIKTARQGKVNWSKLVGSHHANTSRHCWCLLS